MQGLAALGSARRHCQVTPAKPSTTARTSDAARPETTGLRRHLRQAARIGPTGRARTGSPRR